MLYLKSLEIENVKCFGIKQRIDFTESNGEISQWTVILGDNGTGKTSILRSIVSLLPSPQSFLSKRNNSDTEYSLSIDREWKNSWDLKRQEGDIDSRISLCVVQSDKPFGADEEIELDLSYSINHNTKESSSSRNYNTAILSRIYCFAYGANRNVGGKSLSGEKLLQANDTLFFEDALLQNSEEYFLQIDYETAKSRKGPEVKDKVKKLLIEVLPSGIFDIEVRKKGHLQRSVEVKTHFGWVGINELSLGYKTTIAWLIDFAAKMMFYHEKSENPFEEPAILILDEIDLHMHPAWQRMIIENLTRIFTKTQFIVSAHSPLIAQAALNSNLVLLRRIGDHVKVENSPEVVRSWRIDQVLTSDLFGLKESRTKEIEKSIKRRRTLLKSDHLSFEQKKELESLNIKIDAMPIGETKAEIDAMDILKDFAAKLETAKKKNLYD